MWFLPPLQGAECPIGGLSIPNFRVNLRFSLSAPQMPSPVPHGLRSAVKNWDFACSESSGPRNHAAGSHRRWLESTGPSHRAAALVRSSKEVHVGLCAFGDRVTGSLR